MNAALWRKAIVEARLLLVCSTGLLFGFHWIFVWLSSYISLGGMRDFLLTLPVEWQQISGVGVDEVATVMGRIGLAFMDPVVLAVTAIWAIARGRTSSVARSTAAPWKCYWHNRCDAFGCWSLTP
ncbi:MAG: hypothetical protein R3C10_07450 [Pirellulales bacterium]